MWSTPEHLSSLRIHHSPKHPGLQPPRLLSGPLEGMFPPATATCTGVSHPSLRLVNLSLCLGPSSTLAS